MAKLKRIYIRTVGEDIIVRAQCHGARGGLFTAAEVRVKRSDGMGVAVSQLLTKANITLPGSGPST